MTTLHGIPADDIDWIWPRVAPILERAINVSDGKYTLDQVHDYLNTRDMQLWVVEKTGRMLCVCVTQIINFPNKKVLLILFCAGEGMFEWVRLIKPILAWGKNEGCASAEIYGRPGWEKVLPDFGFKKLSCVYDAAL